MGGDSDADAGGEPRRQWDVALSFAGAQRDYVGRVAAALKARGVRCFYDADEQIDLWGKYLAEELPAIYGEQSAAAVIFVSADYARQDWTRLERRTALNRAVRERREYVLPARFDDTPLPGLLSDMVAMDLRRYTPEQFAELVAAKLADLAISPPPPPAGPDAARPPGAVRVAEAELRRLGVHAAISVPGVSDEVPPQYVPRDTDAEEHGVRAKVAAAAARGGFVLLVGGSSVGKTRYAAEAVKELLPDWWLIYPGDPAEVTAVAAAPPARTVVWLDELHRYLDGEHGLVGRTVRALLNAPGPVVIIGTLWPDRHAAYTAVPAHGQADTLAREREVLELAAVTQISGEFSAAEQRQARVAAVRDLRLRVALGAEGYGLTQTLAAAPQLTARWEDAQDADPYAWAVLTAALDAARLGARAPLGAAFLCAAAPGYCTSAQRAEAPANWFEQALAYATARLLGAVAALTPVGARMGRVDGYIVADYLLQHARRQRQATRVLASTWEGLLAHVRNPADTIRLADSAVSRLLYCYAIPLYRHAADAGDGYAARQLVGLLAERGDLDQAEQLLRPFADAGDGYAAGRLAGLLAERGELDELRVRADSGDWDAAERLADLLVDRGDLDELRARAGVGDGHAAGRLAGLLAERGELDELRVRADCGDWDAAERLADLLVDRGDLDQAEQFLRARAGVDDWYAARLLVDLLAERGDLDELRVRADAGDEYAAERLADLLVDRGDLDQAEQFLRARAGAGDGYAAGRLAALRAERGDLDELRVRADDDADAAERLAGLLAERGEVDELRARAGVGDGYAAERLAGLLAERGEVDELRARADAGDWYAAGPLAGLLAERGKLDELRARADDGDWYATAVLANLLADRGDLDQAEQFVRARADVGDGDAQRLAELLTQQGRGQEAERLRRFGLSPDGSIARG